MNLPNEFNVFCRGFHERRYPGVVVQGDTLDNLVRQLAQMKALLEAKW